MGHPLVVLIFAHGYEVNYGVYIGGEGDQFEPQTPANPTTRSGRLRTPLDILRNLRNVTKHSTP
jgi:hypothetical protein